MNKIAQLITKNKWALIALIGIGFAFSIVSLPNLESEMDFNNFFPENDPYLEYHEKASEELGSNDYFIYASLESSNGVFDSIFLRQLESLTRTSKEISGVERVASLTNLKRYSSTPFGIISSPYLHLNPIKNIPQDSVKLFRDFEMNKRFISKDSKTATIVIKLLEELTMDEYNLVIYNLEEVFQDKNLPKSFLMGKKLLEYNYQELMKKEMKVSIILSFSVLIIFLALLFRSWIGIVAPLLVVVTSLIILYGILSVTGRSLGILSGLFPTIILISGISDCIHLLTKYDLNFTGLKSITKSVFKCIEEVGLSIFLTSLTTCVGFLTLTFSPMPVLRNFGIEASIGIALAFLISISLVPALLLIFKSTFKTTISRPMHWMDQMLNLVPGTILNQKSIILLSTMILLTIAIFGIGKLNINNKLLSSIPTNHKLQESYSFFEQNLGGTRSFELIVVANDTFKLNSLEVLRPLQKLHQYISGQAHIDQIISPLTWYHGINKVFDKSLKPLQLPDSEKIIQKRENRMLEYLESSTWNMVNEEKTMGRIVGFQKDLGRIKIENSNARILDWINTNIDTSLLKFQFVGMDLIIDRGHKHRIENMLWGILLALLVVALITGIIYQNMRMSIITIVANIIPLVLIAGFMGFTGIELRGTTSIIFAIGFVIVVDDTIHFLNKFHLERSKGKNPTEAISLMVTETGKAVFTTTLLLFLCFIVLLHSSFADIYLLGILIAMMVMIALAADFFLVPLLLDWFFKKDNHEE